MLRGVAYTVVEIGSVEQDWNKSWTLFICTFPMRGFSSTTYSHHQSFLLDHRDHEPMQDSNPKFNPNLNQDHNKHFSPKFNPNLNQDPHKHFNPKFNPNPSQEPNKHFNPDFDPNLSQDRNQHFYPKFNVLTSWWMNYLGAPRHSSVKEN